jgi:choline dehydrogenase-like flavoprotein
MEFQMKVFAAFVRKVVNHEYHYMATLIVGEDEDSTVNKDFKLRGVEGLRIADLCVCPILTTNHSQVNEHVIGEEERGCEI